MKKFSELLRNIQSAVKLDAIPEITEVQYTQEPDYELKANFEIYDPRSAPQDKKDEMICSLCGEPAKFHCNLCDIYYCCIQHLQQDQMVHDATCEHDAKYLQIIKQSNFGCTNIEIKQLSQLKYYCRNICLQITTDSLLNGNYSQAQTAAVRSLKYATQIYSESSHEILNNYLMISEVYVYLKEYEMSEVGLMKVQTRLRLENQATLASYSKLKNMISKDIDFLDKETMNTVFRNQGVSSKNEFIEEQMQTHIILNNKTSFMELNARYHKIMALIAWKQEQRQQAREFIAASLYYIYVGAGPDSIVLLEYYDVYLQICGEYLTKRQYEELCENIIILINDTLLKHFANIQLFALNYKKSINLIELFHCAKLKDPLFGKNLVIAKNFLQKLYKVNVKFQEFLIELVLNISMVDDAKQLKQKFKNVTTNIKCTPIQLPGFSNLYTLITHLYNEQSIENESIRLIDDSRSEEEVEIVFQ